MISTVRKILINLGGSRKMVTRDNSFQSALLSYGICSNAGDVLIYETFKKMFEEEINLTWHHVRLDELNIQQKNIIIGPGGLLSGSYKPKIVKDQLVIRKLDNKKIESWISAGKNTFAFGTGTNTPFTNISKPFSNLSEQIISKLVESSSGMYLRGSADILRLSQFCNSSDIYKFKFQPCPSVFLDRLFSIKPKVSDQIAVNFPFRKILNKENFKNHPITKFVDFAKSEGLETVFLDNHPDDMNQFIPEIFSEPFSDGMQSSFIAKYYGNDENIKLYEERWKAYDCIASRFNGYRFAFGQRLHSFLPFMAFNTPSVFLAGNEIRMPMPIEYFSNPIFGAKVPLGKGSFLEVVDGMIDRLRYFIKHEDQLRQNIADERARLWQITLHNKANMLSEMRCK